MLKDQSVDLVGPLLERRLKTWAWCECLCVLPIPSLIVDPCKFVTLTPVSPGRPMSHQTQHWPQCPVWGGGTWPVSDLDSSIQSQYPANKHWFWSDLRYSAMIDGEALTFIITVNWLELVCLLIKFGCMHQLTAVVIYLITVAWLSVETLRDSQAAPMPGVSLPKYWKLVSSLWLIIKCEWCQLTGGGTRLRLNCLISWHSKWFLEQGSQDLCINNKSLSGHGRVATCRDEAHEFQFSQKMLFLQSVEMQLEFELRIFSFPDWLKIYSLDSISMMGSQFKI